MNRVNYFSLFTWGIAVFSYYFQFPFSFLSVLIIPCMTLFLFSELSNLKFLKSKKYIICLFCLFAFLVLSMFYSFTKDISINRSLRFLFIILAIIISTMIKDNKFDNHKKVFLYFSLAKCIMLIGIAIYLVINGDHTVIRTWTQMHGYGDIYLLNNIPKVQVQGNALLVISFFIEYMGINKFNPRSFIKPFILLFGVLSAGNFAFIIGIVLFFIYRVLLFIINNLATIKSNKKYLFIISISVLIFMFSMVPYITKKANEKSVVSNKTRVEQAVVLLDTNLFIGNGLGNYVIASTSTREYSGDIYFELQSLYIYNQIGLIGIALFYAVSLWTFFYMSKPKLIIYCIYLVYTFWNPYCFDTTQIFAIVAITNMIGKGEDYEESNYYSLLSLKRKYREYN